MPGEQSIESYQQLLSHLERDLANVMEENRRLKAQLDSVDEDPTLKYLEQKLSTKGEHSLCETIDNVYRRLEEARCLLDYSKTHLVGQTIDKAWNNLREEWLKGTP